MIVPDLTELVDDSSLTMEDSNFKLRVCKCVCELIHISRNAAGVWRIVQSSNKEATWLTRAVHSVGPWVMSGLQQAADNTEFGKVPFIAAAHFVSGTGSSKVCSFM